MSLAFTCNGSLQQLHSAFFFLASLLAPRLGRMLPMNGKVASRYEVFTLALMKIQVFWDMILSALK
jgi:hypothetical protein